MFVLCIHQLHKRMLFSSFAKIAGARKKKSKERLSVLINPVSCFSHMSAVRFSPENL